MASSGAGHRNSYQLESQRAPKSLGRESDSPVFRLCTVRRVCDFVSLPGEHSFSNTARHDLRAFENGGRMLAMIAAVEGSRPQTHRDRLLDVWRGLALVDMAWVHLALYPIGMPEPLAQWIGQYTRFAAGAFVIVSGIAVARVFGTHLFTRSPEGTAVRWRLFRRALLLLVLDRLVAVTFILMEGFRLGAPEPHTRWPLVLDLILFRLPGVTGGLLFLYSLLLLVTPAVELLRRRFGAVPTLALSAMVYTVGYSTGSLGQGTPWPFPFACWQLLFVWGYVGAPWFARLSSGGASRWWGSTVTTAFALVFLIRNGAALGVPVGTLAQSWFVKVPLSPGEAVWYGLASLWVMTVTTAVWRRWGSLRSGLSFFERLGRKSLVVYVAHLLLEVPLLEVLTLADPSPIVRTLALVWMAAALYVVAFAAEWLDKVLDRHPWLLPKEVTLTIRIPRGFVVGAAVAGVALLSLPGMQRFFVPPLWLGGELAEEALPGSPAADAVIDGVDPTLPEVTIEEAGLEESGGENMDMPSALPLEDVPAGEELPLSGEDPVQSHWHRKLPGAQVEARAWKVEAGTTGRERVRAI